jgi:hypothetical protein
MAMLTLALLATVMSSCFGNPDCRAIRTKRYQFVFRTSGAVIKFIVANQSKDYPNFILNDRDVADLVAAADAGRGDHFIVVMARVNSMGVFTYFAHIDFAEALRRFPMVRHNEGDFGGYRLLPPNFCAPDFGTVVVEDDSLDSL